MVIKIFNVVIPENSAIFVSLTKIYGIGKTTSFKILKCLNINPHSKAKELSEDDISNIIKEIKTNYLVEDDLRQDIFQKIESHSSVSCRRAVRRALGLPIFARSRNTRRDSKGGSKRGEVKNKIKKSFLKTGKKKK